mmetsp:Transcript_105117/g.277663  ORF Transcript_105117/g.277663 Transcript_105117/m.277663 type:complete len:281 (+) Transcript_105117:213-1055(+)
MELVVWTVIFVILLCDCVVHVRPPARGGEALPLRICSYPRDSGRIGVRRRNRKFPVVVKPPEREPFSHPRGQTIPAEVHLVGRRLGGHLPRVVVKVGVDATLVEPAEPLFVVRESGAIGLIILPISIILYQAPVHVKSPDIERHLVVDPALDLRLRRVLRVEVPPREPRAEAPVGKERNRSRQFEELLACSAPTLDALPHQEDICVALDVVAEIIAIVRAPILCGSGCNLPIGHKEPRVVHDRVASTRLRRWPVQLVPGRVRLRVVDVVPVGVPHPDRPV